MMIKPLADFLYPGFCLGCETRLEGDRHFICPDCFEELPKYEGTERYYGAIDRLQGFVPFTEYQSDLIFRDPSITRTLIHNIKYNDYPMLGYELAKQFAPRHLELKHFIDVTMITPIPLTLSRLRKRTYNQSTYIAKGLAEIYQIPVIEGVLERNPSLGTQTKRGKEARWEHLEKAFLVPEGMNLSGKRILIVDDVLTTGATLINAAKVLIDAGAESVSFYTLALDVLN